MATKKKVAIKPLTVEAIKGFDKNLKCRDFQYEIGKTFAHDGGVKACESGFHSVDYPLDVFNYYDPSESRFCVVDAGGEISKDSDDSKIASAEITIKAEIKLPEIAVRAVDWIMARIESTKTESNSGISSAATNTGDSSAASVEGLHSVAIATGFYGKAKGSIGCAIVLVNRRDDGSIKHIKSSIVGENGVKADTWYTLSENNEFVEVTE